MDDNRFYNGQINVDKENVKKFFDKRAEKAKNSKDSNVTMLQDDNPEIALKRDEYEKKFVWRHLPVDTQSRVLDIGCGIGRWGEAFLESNVAAYYGIDISDGLIEIAKSNFKDYPNFQFEVSDPINFLQSKDQKLDIVIVSGVLNYINDNELQIILKELNKVIAPNGVIYFRIPISVQEKRLTLKEHWSEELNEFYSSIYRTNGEYIEAFKEQLVDMELIVDEFLYKEDQLNNREETKQKVYILKK